MTVFLTVCGSQEVPVHSACCSLDFWQCEVIAKYFSPYSVQLSFWNVSDTHGMHIQ